MADVFSEERFFSIGAMNVEGYSMVDFLPLLDLFGGDISKRLNNLFWSMLAGKKTSLLLSRPTR